MASKCRAVQLSHNWVSITDHGGDVAIIHHLPHTMSLRPLTRPRFPFDSLMVPHMMFSRHFRRIFHFACGSRVRNPSAPLDTCNSGSTANSPPSLTGRPAQLHHLVKSRLFVQNFQTPQSIVTNRFNDK